MEESSDPRAKPNQLMPDSSEFIMPPPSPPAVAAKYIRVAFHSTNMLAGYLQARTAYARGSESRPASAGWS